MKLDEDVIFRDFGNRSFRKVEAIKAIFFVADNPLLRGGRGHCGQTVLENYLQGFSAVRIFAGQTGLLLSPRLCLDVNGM